MLEWTELVIPSLPAFLLVVRLGLIILGLTVRNHWYLPVTSSCVLLQQRTVVYNFVITGNLKRNIAQFIVFTLQRPLILEQCLMVRRSKKYPLTQHFVTFYIPFMP